MDSLVNHLDKIQEMTEDNYKPKVIMRTSIGAKNPLDGGVQHTQDYTQVMKDILNEVNVVLLNEPEEIFPTFESAYERDGSSLIIEWGDYYNEK
jgi:pyruvate/2-oxoglutarate/acetoin dehydrogenase E1 component